MHIVHDFETGGVQAGIGKLLSGLDPGKFEQIVCAITSGYPPDPATQARLIALKHVLGKPVFLVPELAKLFLKERPDVVHSRNWGAIEAVPAAKIARIPAVLHTEHGRDVQSLSRMPWRRRLFRRLCYGWADRVFTVSEEMKRYYAAATGLAEDRLEIVPDGVDTSVFRPDDSVRRRLRHELGFAENTFVAGCVARLDPIKNLRALLRAAEIGLEKGIDVRVLLVGDGPERAALETHVERCPALRDRVRFAGEQANVIPWLNALDVFVLPSRFEGTSVALLEAMAVGVPVLASAVGGNPEVIEHERSGLLFAAGDAEMLASLLQRLSGDAALRTTLRSNARYRVEKRFSARHMLDCYSEIYSSAVNKRCGEQLPAAEAETPQTWEETA
jgi:sugar transferase (PEP-CTERM/EpsH1 system associated)